jgi:uncharacterized protein DUF6127
MGMPATDGIKVVVLPFLEAGMTGRDINGFVRMPEDEFEAMLARAAEQGARRALADVGLDGPEAAIDIHDLRTLLESLRMARRTAWQTIVRLITTGLLLALIAGIAVKLKLFG